MDGKFALTGIMFISLLFLVQSAQALPCAFMGDVTDINEDPVYNSEVTTYLQSTGEFVENSGPELGDLGKYSYTIDAGDEYIIFRVSDNVADQGPQLCVEGATEFLDLSVTDDDDDGYGEGEDCNDTDPEVHPPETNCTDGLDNDCDGFIDDADSDCWGPFDKDEDGYTDDVDCDDGDPEINPGAEELCDLVDNDCDTYIDNNPGTQDPLTRKCYSDGEFTYDPEKYPDTTCKDGKETCAEVEGDAVWQGCNAVHKTALQCNGKDNDCNGFIDEDHDGADCGGGGGGGGGGSSGYCGDGKLKSTEDCEVDGDCEEAGYFCEECKCVKCEEDWECTEWNECSEEGVQTRTCTDKNECGTTDEKPSESQPCEYVTSGDSVDIIPLSETFCGDDECEEEEDCENCPEDCGECASEATIDGLTGFFTGLPGVGILGLVALALILLLLFFTKKRDKGKKGYSFTKK